MRHQELQNVEAFDIVELAEFWPERAAEIEAGLGVKGEPAVPDMPASAGVMMVGVYAALMGAFALTLAHESHAIFAIAIGVFFVVIFFAVPVLFLRLEQDGTRRPTLTMFMERGIDTAMGRIGGAAALVQMLIVPFLLALAILAIGVINLLI